MLTGCIMFPPPSWHPMQAFRNNEAPLCTSMVCPSESAWQKQLKHQIKHKSFLLKENEKKIFIFAKRCLYNNVVMYISEKKNNCIKKQNTGTMTTSLSTKDKIFRIVPHVQKKLLHGMLTMLSVSFAYETTLSTKGMSPKLVKKK